MPKKIRELKAKLLKAGFTYRSGKGSHTVWSHPELSYSLILSGKDGADAAIRNVMYEMPSETWKI
ncbi:hypothetical protein NIES4074_31170 [Cylindrospermum sp. NIES-4074]|nr:hypothetical protein NIES4074_31170 [Cylindrospermum sp. NIES-4074]